MKPAKLNFGDKVAIVSLSRGLLGEKFIDHELELGVRRLEEFGLTPVFMPNSKKGMTFTEKNPKARIDDLKAAFLDKSIKGIICAIGGDDGYKTIPYMFDDKEFAEAVKNNPKVFLGFSDSTVHHLALNKLGLNTFYGPSFLVDFAELDSDMLSYTKYWVLNLFINRKATLLESSRVWYKERTDFSPAAVGTPREVFLEERGYLAPCAGGACEGELYGGCLDRIYEIIKPLTAEHKKVYTKYNIWQQDVTGKILFLETSDEKPEPKKFKEMLIAVKDTGAFDKCAGVLFGKPQDEAYFDEYLQIIKELLPSTKVMCNLNFGHAFPHCIMPYGCKCRVDLDKLSVEFTEPMFSK